MGDDPDVTAWRSWNEKGVPLSAIRALVQQWRKKGNELCPDKQQPHMGWPATDWTCRVVGAVMLEHADQLAALCPAPPEDQK